MCAPLIRVRVNRIAHNMFALLGKGDGWLNENAGGAVSTLIALELATHAHTRRTQCAKTPTVGGSSPQPARYGGDIFAFQLRCTMETV